MFLFRYFVFELRHDSGTSYLKTISFTPQAALNTIMRAENCPDHAISMFEIDECVYSNTSSFIIKNKLYSPQNDVIWKS